VGPLIAALTHPDENVRWEARALGEIADPTAAPTLISELNPVR
jgi:HEAT repeat protein